VVLFGLTFALPFFVWGLVSNYAQGTLTLPFTIEMAVGLGALGALAAIAVWYTITLPIIRRTKK
jgi:hypothetical protein